MAVTVKIPTQLRAAAGGEAELTVEGATVGEVLDAVYERHGELRDRLSDGDGGLRRFVNVYVDGEDIRFTDGLADAGGRRPRGPDPARRRRRLRSGAAAQAGSSGLEARAGQRQLRRRPAEPVALAALDHRAGTARDLLVDRAHVAAAARRPRSPSAMT